LPGFIDELAATYHAPFSQGFQERKLVIIQFRKGDAFRVAIKLFILLLVSHFTQFTSRCGQANRNNTPVRGIRASPLRLKRRLCQAQFETGSVSGPDRKKFQIF